MVLAFKEQPKIGTCGGNVYLEFNQYLKGGHYPPPQETHLNVSYGM